MGEISTTMEDEQRKRSYIFNIAVVIAALALASMIGTLSVLFIAFIHKINDICTSIFF
jgi:hypothetical protein